jgi:hypothetical protein
MIWRTVRPEESPADYSSDAYPRRGNISEKEQTVPGLHMSGKRVTQELASCPHTTSAVAGKELVQFSTVATMYVFVPCQYGGGLTCSSPRPRDTIPKERTS